MREIFTLLLLVSAVIPDVRCRKIPNCLIVAGWCMAGAVRLYSEGLYGIFAGIRSAVLVILCGFPFFLMRGIGAGDIKLWSVLAALYGVGFFFEVAAVLFALAALYSLWILWRKRNLCGKIFHGEKHLVFGRGRKRDGGREKDREKITIILAPFTLLGYVLVLAGKWGGIC